MSRVGFKELFIDTEVLVVDDNGVAREVLLKTLQSLGIKGETVASGEEAISALEAKAYDVVLMDWKMPFMDGVETTRKIRENKLIGKKPKIIMVTAYGRDDVSHEFLKEKLDALLIKPVSPSVMLDAFMNVIGKENVPNVIQRNKSGTLSSIKEAKILLVEDNEINREFAQEMLLSEGMIVDCAHDGFEAIEMAKASHYDLILMDIQMPNLDGIEATKRIRKLQEILSDDYYESVPIIALSANALQADVNLSLDAGMNAYVTKPINPPELFEEILKWVPAKNSDVSENISQESNLPAPSHEFDYSALKGIEIDNALNRIMHNEKLYVKLLKRFYDVYSKDFYLVVKLIEESQIQEAEFECHKLKGIVANLGATELFHDLNALDTKLKENQDIDSEELSALKNSVELLMESIGEFLEQTLQNSNPEIETKTYSNEDLAVLLEEIIELLEQDINQAMEKFDEFKSICLKAIDVDELKAMEDALEIFDIDATKEIAKRMLISLQKNEK